MAPYYQSRPGRILPWRRVLVRRGFVLEYLTLGWNVVGIVVLAVAAIGARSVALAGFGWTPLSSDQRQTPAGKTSGPVSGRESRYHQVWR